MLGFGRIRFQQYVWARLLRLPRPQYGVRVKRNIAISMRDGQQLLHDHYRPLLAEDAPTVLIRTPYGRGRERPFTTGFTLAELPARRIAEQGYHVIVQGVRGRFKSSGTFDPYAQEAQDGADTVDWIGQQPWFNGRLGTWGPSYLGYAQWAAATARPAAVHALVPTQTNTNPYTVTYPNGAFGLETRLRWSVSTFLQDRKRVNGRLARRAAGVDPAFNQLPLETADQAAAGQPISYFRELLAAPSAEAPYWQARNLHSQLDQIDAPIHFVGGWYDYFLPGMLQDYERLVAAGKRPSLSIGPWHHTDPNALLFNLQTTIQWFATHLQNNPAPKRSPVCLYVLGEQQWRWFDQFPPLATEQRCFLQPNGRLDDQPPPDSAPDSYRYDPADPTPTVGGPLLVFRGAGAQDNAWLEARDDVLTYTTAVQTAPLTVIGRVRVRLYATAERPFTDFTARLCLVDREGVSRNLCDGLVRVTPETAVWAAPSVLELAIELGMIAFQVKVGERLRLQIASGAHPRWNRNPGTGEPTGTAEELLASRQQIYHQPEFPSYVALPVWTAD